MGRKRNRVSVVSRTTAVTRAYPVGRESARQYCAVAEHTLGGLVQDVRDLMSNKEGIRVPYSIERLIDPTLYSKF